MRVYRKMTMFLAGIGVGITSILAAQDSDELARLPLKLKIVPEVRLQEVPLDQAVRSLATAVNAANPEGRPVEIHVESDGQTAMPTVNANVLDQDLDLILEFITEQVGFDWRIEDGRIVVFTNPELQELNRRLRAIPGRNRLRATILPDFALNDTPLSAALATIEEMARIRGLRQLVGGGPGFEIVAGYRNMGEELRVSGRFEGSDLDTVLEVITKQTRQIDWTVEKGKVVIIIPEYYGENGRVIGIGSGPSVDPFASPASSAADPFAAAPAASRRPALPVITAPGVPQPPGFNTEAYPHLKDNPFLSPRQEPLSTFSIDVDTASYANVRRFLLQQGTTPPVDAVRIEELVNYFDYEDLPPPEIAGAPRKNLPVEHPFATTVEVASAPWKPRHRLVRIGLKGYEIPRDKRPASNLVFLLDVSGSMSAENKLPLVKRSMQLLLNGLDENDRVAIVVYAGASGLALEATPATKSKKITRALTALDAGGSTNGGEGLRLAYRTALANLIPEGNNRVILCTDGDFNVGVTGESELKSLVESHSQKGIQLTVLGFGMGNLKDDKLETISNYGDGNYGYIDGEREARKLFGQRLLGTLVMIGKDVKMQVEFNPRHVAAYRLIGYENRMLENQDFANDKVDAGDIGAGHTVTAFYEIVPPGVELPKQPGGINLRYQKTELTELDEDVASELMTLKLRYKWPGEKKSELLEVPVTDGGGSYREASRDFRFGAAVAGFGMLLRESPHRGRFNFDKARAIASDSLGPDPWGERAEFLQLLDRLVW